MTSQVLWTLIAIQIAMGAFDTFYHHELTERLAWRPSQRHELQLHGVRNMLYALLFLILGWLEVHGLLALNYGAILVLLLPVLIDWAGHPTAIRPAFYGFWSILAAVSAVGVSLFGLRDLAASRRLARLDSRSVTGLVAGLPGRQTILVTGATGFIGQRLVLS